MSKVSLNPYSIFIGSILIHKQDLVENVFDFLNY
jgi:hypothetical protein